MTVDSPPPSTDRVARWLWAALAILYLPYVLPLLGAEATAAYADVYASCLILPLIVLLVAQGIGRLPTRERIFWSLISLAFALWWLVALATAFVPWSWWGPTADVLTDMIYGSSYLAWFLAAAVSPHQQVPLLADRRERRLRSAGVIVLLVGLLIYFIGIPASMTPDDYLSWIPSLYFYIALDALLIAVFGRLAWSVERPRWQAVYSWLTAYLVLTLATDVLELLGYFGTLQWQVGGPSEILWGLPTVPLAVAVHRRRRQASAASGLQEEVALSKRAIPRPSPLVLALLVFPLIHLFFDRAGLLHVEAASARERLILVCLATLGLLAWIESRYLKRIAARADGELAEIQGLRVAREVAAHATEARSRFVAGISHEIRTPLTGILGMADLLVRVPMPATSQRYTEILDNCAKGLLGTIDGLLEYSKIEAGQLRVQPQPTDLRRLLHSVVQPLTSQAAAERIELTSSLADATPGVVEVDASWLRKVLSILLANAVKFTHQGSVQVRVSSTPLLADSESAEAGRSGMVLLRFTVVDSGIGIDEETRARLFQPFSQGDTSTSRRFGGTGLGLATCHRIVTAMGGDIGVDSSPGLGASFWLELPVVASPQASESGTG